MGEPGFHSAILSVRNRPSFFPSFSTFVVCGGSDVSALSFLNAAILDAHTYKVSLGTRTLVNSSSFL